MHSPIVPHPLVDFARRMMTAKEVGTRLGMSWRTVLRHADAGLIPYGVKLGSLRRWDSYLLEEWIAAGCKPVRSAGRGQ